tara:strand:+ start:1216 stop:1959 length:744 start_codon:yes stop_codon:yes gene_type:complete
MFEKIIEFSASEIYTKKIKIKPEPIKLSTPEWFKKLSHSPLDKTIKGCMPFLDTLTSGYLLRMPIDYYLRFNIEDSIKGNLSRVTDYNIMDMNDELSNFLNISKVNNHPISQISKECPYAHKNRGYEIMKITNPWTIKTPPGYACLFLPPLNNSDDRFSIIPGIVDTDSFPAEINFPFIVNGDKYEKLDTIIKEGTPYVQVIPFKRDSWKMNIVSEKKDKIIDRRIFSIKRIIHSYKNTFWSKKSWK